MKITFFNIESFKRQYLNCWKMIASFLHFQDLKNGLKYTDNVVWQCLLGEFFFLSDYINLYVWFDQVLNFILFFSMIQVVIHIFILVYFCSSIDENCYLISYLVFWKVVSCLRMEYIVQEITTVGAEAQTGVGYFTTNFFTIDRFATNFFTTKLFDHRFISPSSLLGQLRNLAIDQVHHLVNLTTLSKN